MRPVKFKLSKTLFAVTVIGAIVLMPDPAGTAAFAAARGKSHGQSSQSTQAPLTATLQSPAPQAITGAWKLNRTQSDDPSKKLVSDENIPLGDLGTATPAVGQLGGRANNGQQSSGNVPPGAMGGMGAPSGMTGVGGLNGPGAGGPMPMPQAPPSHGWETDKDRQKRLEGLMPAASLTIEQKENEYDLVEDQGRKQILYTDGRKLKKSKDDKVQEFVARFDAGHLTYDEKRPPRGTITRSFELSFDGRQMFETTTIDNGSIAAPIVIRYVYDAAPATKQP